ncbi:MAG TPA: hypothetical protein VGU74_02075 [Gemmatimonadales bacterium]|nr:hypothetical protein [Gemmatimonadales bacterium]
MITLLLLLVQTQGWVVAPHQPTVGDTINLERAITAPPGWRVRAGKLASTSEAEPLGDPVVAATATPGSWLIRYTVVAWTPGAITLEMPPLWRLGPDGGSDSLAGGNATFRVASVIPDSVKSPAPKPSLGPLRPERLSPLPVIAAVVIAVSALLLLVAWRRRAPRALAHGPALASDGEVPDARWLAAGEPKAVAARAAHRLRRALARSIPEAHEALSTTECLQAVERARPDAPLRDLRELLLALDQVAFATAHGVEVAPLAARARALARELGESRSSNGGRGGGAR